AQADPEQAGAEQTSIREQIKTLDGELTNLVALAAASGSAALLDGIRQREQRKADLTARLASLDTLASVPQMERDGLRESLRAILDDWRGLLLGEVAVSRQIMKRVVNGRMTLNSDGHFTGMASYGKVLSAVVHNRPDRKGGEAPLRGS